MYDLITYTKDSKVFLAEVVKTCPELVVYSDFERKQPVSISILKGLTIRDKLGTVSLLRCNDKQLAALKALKTIQILVQVAPDADYLAAMSTANRKTYDSIHSQTPVALKGMDGKPLLDSKRNPKTFTPSPYIGAFK